MADFGNFQGWMQELMKFALSEPILIDNSNTIFVISKMVSLFPSIIGSLCYWDIGNILEEI